ncbi:hypothetical protein BD309DRAFT_993389 [Dichomitus squalens]|uniref:Uncharacterized protein n=1 Tax=Dichomitus squalens TaxID=114155 RepID=A0A4Q9NFT8_9APHY|nr:hypothetical protein BD309DRAFT_993389 [Dichomitus squalens]TBU51814.1 hypothetical protein BD310DRAFT_953063 [Dichomitus squalens]
MARWCNLCQKSFVTHHGFTAHNRRVHKNPKPSLPLGQGSTFRYHPHLNARLCDREGNFLPADVPPLLPDDINDFAPFEDQPSFEFAELLFEKMHSSSPDINQLLRILSAKRVIQTNGQDSSNGFFASTDTMYDTIDDIDFGNFEWKSIKVRYTGPMDPDAHWMGEEYEFHYRDIEQAMVDLARNAEFEGSWDYTPFEEYPTENNRCFSNLMSARFAWKQADKIAQDPATHGAMLFPLILGVDKTTEFHPVYASAGNLANSMRRAHGEGVIPIAFLPIPKTVRQHSDSAAFRAFKKQLYHDALAHVLAPLRPWMTTPRVIRCPDGHYRRAIFELSPFIADYPEQVYVSGVVSHWCPKCRARPTELENEGPPRFREHTECLMETFDAPTLWDVFGIDSNVVPFTYRFPRADIHELLSPDLLHQLIKGTFKDHLVEWVTQYIHLTAESEAEAKRIMDDIDRRIAAAPSFPGLRRFPDGRNFSQWTGNNSKALMKVYLPAITGYVPSQVSECIANFLQFCYLARRPSHDTRTLHDMEVTLAKFHELRRIFEDVGVRPDGISLPRQHALVHYIRSIRLFGSPNGLCSSITESKHIVAVKRPWRSSNSFHPIQQIVSFNTRLSKMAAARMEFGRRGMLQDDVLTDALLSLDAFEGPAPGFQSDTNISFAARANAGLPKLREHIRRFLHDDLFPELDAGDAIPLEQCPYIANHLRIGVYHHAYATFFAPSEMSGLGGMHREVIRCNPLWYGQYARYDTVLVNLESDGSFADGTLIVARVLLFFSFIFEDTKYESAFVEWFLLHTPEPDHLTGMWVIEPEILDSGERAVGVVSIDCIVRVCHLMPVFGTTRMPVTFHFSDTLDAF